MKRCRRGSPCIDEPRRDRGSPSPHRQAAAAPLSHSQRPSPSSWADHLLAAELVDATSRRKDVGPPHAERQLYGLVRPGGRKKSEQDHRTPHSADPGAKDACHPLAAAKTGRKRTERGGLHAEPPPRPWYFSQPTAAEPRSNNSRAWMTNRKRNVRTPRPKVWGRRGGQIAATASVLAERRHWKTRHHVELEMLQGAGRRTAPGLLDSGPGPRRGSTAADRDKPAGHEHRQACPRRPEQARLAIAAGPGPLAAPAATLAAECASVCASQPHRGSASQPRGSSRAGPGILTGRHWRTPPSTPTRLPPRGGLAAPPVIAAAGTHAAAAAPRPRTVADQQRSRRYVGPLGDQSGTRRKSPVAAPWSSPSYRARP